MIKLDDFDYYLPENLIAQDPLERRDESRLMVLHKDTGETEHRRFKDVLDYLVPGDCVVINDTKVIPARLLGVREDTKGKIEFVLLKNMGEDVWEVLVKPGRRAKTGSVFVFGNGELKAQVIETTEVGGRLVRFFYDGIFQEVLEKFGNMPLPPYIKKPLKDKSRYQTVYATKEGSAAAPTAGLHFTGELIDKIRLKCVDIVPITLHVGLGTFRPVKVQDITKHRMHSEYFEVSPEAAERINKTKRSGGRIWAVGTTSVRTLETISDSNGTVRSRAGWTDIFIYPGYTFKCVDVMITNFHLPKSTLIMLVSAFAGKENVLNAYREAVRHKYRFFSFGDAMLIL